MADNDRRLGRPKALKPSKGPSKTYSYVDREPFGIIRFYYRSLGMFATSLTSWRG
jgi:hypothetical protein